MGGAHQNRIPVNAARLLNQRARIEHDLSGHYQCVDAHNRRAFFAVVKHGHTHLAGVVERPVETFSVATRLFHANVGRDVALGESRLDAGKGRRRLGSLCCEKCA